MAERVAPEAEREEQVTPKAERVTPKAERVTPKAERVTPKAERVTPKAGAEVLEPAKIKRAAPPQVPEGWDPRESEQSLRAARSYNGYPWDQVISAEQKSVRQGWVYDAIYWALEAFFAGVKATLTNTWNREEVMTLEDIGPADPSLLPLVFYCSAAHRNDPQAIAACAYLLAKSRKTRVNDWEAVYNSFPQLADMCFRDKDYPTAVAALAKEAGAPEELRSQLIEALRRTQLVKAVRLIKMLRLHPDRLAPGVRAEYGILQAFQEVAGKNSEYLKVCERLALSPNWKWKSSGPEGKTLLVYNHMATLWCSGKWKEAEATIPKTASGEVDTNAYEDRLASVAEIVDPLVATHEEGGMELLGIPDIALDMHTSRGKALKRGLQFFMDVGSQLANEDPNWHNISEWFRSRIVIC